MTGKSAFRGCIAFFIILLTMPLGHAFVVLMERYLDGVALRLGAALLGAAGIALAIGGNRLPGRAMRMLAGAFGAILFWGAWVEFSYICYGSSLPVPPLMADGQVFTKPEYRLMPSSFPFAVLAFIIYLYWAPSRWGVVLWLRRRLAIDCRRSASSLSAQATNLFIELLLLIWWCYLVLLVEFDPTLLGPRHVVTLVTAGFCLLVWIVLFVRSLRAPSWASALRQAVVNVCILWTFVEVMIKLRLFTEVWIYPEQYIAEMIIIVVAFVVALGVMARNGHKNIRHGGNS